MEGHIIRRDAPFPWYFVEDFTSARRCRRLSRLLRDDDMNVEFSVAEGDNIRISGSKGFVADIDHSIRMSLNRFKQIRGAFHPEDRKDANGADDKCYQLRTAINELNSASNANRVPDANCSFDEGGIACCSRYCPVRQYNTDKPNKFRVDFFILASSKIYMIYQI